MAPAARKPKFNVANNLKIDQFFKPLPKMRDFSQENEISQEIPSSFGKPMKGTINENHLKKPSSNLIKNEGVGIKRASSDLISHSQYGLNPFGIKRSSSNLTMSSDNCTDLLDVKKIPSISQNDANTFGLKKTSSDLSMKSDTASSIKRTSSNLTDNKQAKGTLDAFFEREVTPVRIFVDENEGCEIRPQPDPSVIQARALQKKKIKPLNTYDPTNTTTNSIFRDEEDSPSFVIYRDDLNTQYIPESSLVRPEELVESGPYEKFKIYVDEDVRSKTDTQQSSPVLLNYPDSQEDDLPSLPDTQKKATQSPPAIQETESITFSDEEEGYSPFFFGDSPRDTGSVPTDEFSVVAQNVNESIKEPEKSFFQD